MVGARRHPSKSLTIRERPSPVLPFLVFWEFLVFFPCEDFLVFLSVFPFFSRDFRGSEGIKNPFFLWFFLPLSKKTRKGRTGRGVENSGGWWVFLGVYQAVSNRRFVNKRFSQLKDESCWHVRERSPSKCCNLPDSETLYFVGKSAKRAVTSGWRALTDLPTSLVIQFREQPRGVENSGGWKTYRKFGEPPPPQKRFWTPHLRYVSPPLFGRLSVISLKRKRHRPDQTPIS